MASAPAIQRIFPPRGWFAVCLAVLRTTVLPPMLSTAMVAMVAVAMLTSDVCAASPAPLHERIDRMIEDAHVGPMAERCTDAEFLRRAALDLTGVVPSADEVRAFLDDASPNKREQLIDRLLESPSYALHMTDTLDVMLMERRPDKYVKSPEWREWLHASVTANKPYNVLAAEILGADGVEADKRAPAKFYLDREAETNLLTRDVGRVFFGRDLQCAQCHDHPVIDDYLQAEYYGIYAFLSRSYLFTDAKQKVSMLAEKAEGDVDFKSVFTGEEGKTPPRLPGGDPLAEPTFEKGQEYDVKPEKNVRPIPKYSRREQLARLVSVGENEAFRRNIVNRLWAHMLGRGIVDPPDLHHSDNPPSHPELLALLADEFAAGDYDMQALLRELALTETYQRSFETPSNLEQQAASVAGELAHMEAERAKLEQAAETAMKTAGAAVSALLKSRETAAVASQEEQQKAAAAVVAAKKTAAVASEQVASAEKQLVEHRQTAQLLAAADKAAKQAVGRLMKDDELAKAAALFAARLADVNKQVAAAEKQIVDRKLAAKEATEQLAVVEKALADLTAKAAVAQKQISTLEAAVAKSEAERDAARDALHQFEKKLSATQKLAEFAAVAQDTVEARAKLAAGDDKLEANVREMLEAQAGKYAVARQSLSSHFSERFAVATLKPLTPEQLAWSILQVTGQLDAQRTAAAAAFDKKAAADEAAAKNAVKPDDGDAKDDKAKDKEQPPIEAEPLPREVQIETAARAKLQGVVNTFVSLFGGAPGTPQQDFVATVDQALFLSNGSQIRAYLKPSGTNVIARSLTFDEPQPMAEELYLSIFGRLPSEQETADVAAYLASQPEAQDGAIQEIAWALLTSAEFRFNH